MHTRQIVGLIGAALLAYALYATHHPTPPSPDARPVPAQPAPTPPKPKPRPHCPCPGPHCPCPDRERVCSADRPQLGGAVSPDGTVRILFLPPAIDWPKNIPSRGLGCCGFRSIDYCARVAGVTELIDLPERMRKDGIPGGDWPQKHSQIMAKYAPHASWWQDTSGAIELLEASFRSQRPCCCDYSGHDPHYSGGIAHCVTVVACDQSHDWVAILDNNYPDIDEIVWLHVDAFRSRWHGWSYGLLARTPGDCPRPGAHPWGDASTLNGSPATVADIAAALGGTFVPIDVNVDHKLEPLTLQFDPLTLGLISALLLGWYILSNKDKEGGK